MKCNENVGDDVNDMPPKVIETFGGIYVVCGSFRILCS